MREWKDEKEVSRVLSAAARVVLKIDFYEGRGWQWSLVSSLDREPSSLAWGRCAGAITREEAKPIAQRAAAACFKKLTEEFLE